MTAPLETVRDEWLRAWPRALEAWSHYLQLRTPRLCLSSEEAAAEGLDGSFAMIRLQDQCIVVDLPSIRNHGLDGFPVEVMAHEIGHHVLAPATLTDHARMLARIRRGLPTLEQHAPYIANLYSDLLINDRLQRSVGLRMAEVYRQLVTPAEPGKLWKVYTRIYEMLWSLPPGELGSKGKLPDEMEGDAWLGARLIRHFARDRLAGAGRFAVLMLPYLLADASDGRLVKEWHDTRDAGRGGQPDGLTEIEDDELSGAVHPGKDAELSGLDDDAGEPATGAKTVAQGQAREPYEYGEILKAAGVALSDHEIAVRYYKERASPHLIRFPRRQAPQSTDPLPEGLEPWGLGEPLDAVDWLQSVLISPKIIPSVSTVQRVWGTSEGHDSRPEPIDLDLYVDSSGSMPDPQRITSFLTLAGTILSLSALRAGARVKATLWSGKNEVTQTAGFVRDAQAVMEVITGCYGGGTQFPIPELRETYRQRSKAARATHIVVISDDGVSTMFDHDEQGNDGWQIAREALRSAGGGGTLLLNLPANWEQGKQYAPYAAIARARDELGWNVFSVTKWDELVLFARAFSRLKYGNDGGKPGTAAA